ncbi:MAG: CDP-tyvelose epimerase [Acidobacteria bacterium]|nr:MAG: CDP-tyvelose epimerase [Acidobacteriota bacterium]
MKVLITGICGFIGSALARRIKEADPTSEVFGIDNLMRSGSEANRRLDKFGIRVFHGDIRCVSDTETLPLADWVVDAAANPSVLAGVDGRASTRQLVEHNLFGTVNTLEYCRRHGAGFVLLSTSRVYSIRPLSRMTMQIEKYRLAPCFNETRVAGFSKAGISEEFGTAAPISLYGATKLASEALALEYGETFGFPVWINRCGVLAGAGQFGTAEQGIFSFWIHAWHAGKPLRYIGFGGKGLQVRDAFHPDDLSTLVLSQIQKQASTPERICNVAGGLSNSMSLLELSNWCSDRFGPRDVIPDANERPFDIPWMVLDTRRARQQWAWKPSRTLSSILSEIADHAEKHPDWLELTS